MLWLDSRCKTHLILQTRTRKKKRTCLLAYGCCFQLFLILPKDASFVFFWTLLVYTHTQKAKKHTHTQWRRKLLRYIPKTIPTVLQKKKRERPRGVVTFPFLLPATTTTFKFADFLFFSLSLCIYSLIPKKPFGFVFFSKRESAKAPFPHFLMHNQNPLPPPDY